MYFAALLLLQFLVRYLVHLFSRRGILNKISLHIVVVKSQPGVALVTGDVLTRKMAEEAKEKEKQTHLFFTNTRQVKGLKMHMTDLVPYTKIN